MSEYCSQCQDEFWDIDLMELALELDNGHSENFICERCNNKAVYKDENGNLFLARQFGDEIKLVSVNIEDLQAKNDS